MRIAILDTVHPIITEYLKTEGYQIDLLYEISRKDFIEIVSNYEGIILRSRIKMNKELLQQASNLKFIGRPGAGLENIDLEYCNQKGIKVFRSPEGNMDAVGEHILGMLFSLFKNINKSALEVQEGRWLREENRGVELKGKTVGIIGYGYMGSTLAKKLQGLDVNIIAYDKYKTGFSTTYVEEVSLERLFAETDVLSLHTPLTPETHGLINETFINRFTKDIYIINTARGKSLVTEDLVKALKTKKVKGACLDVLEYESSSFEFLDKNTMPEPLKYLLEQNNVIITPHIAGWTHEAKYKMGEVLVNKILKELKHQN